MPRALLGDDRTVHEEIQVDRLAGRARLELREMVAQLFGIEQRRRQRAQTARLRDRDCQLGVHGACHWRKNDRMLDPEQIQQAAIRPHGAFPG
jgi:hypothetical protein